MLNGLYLGLRRGNFRFKAALESHHSLKKNEMAMLPGQKGADPAHAPEHLVSQVQYHESLMLGIAALDDRDPDLMNKIKSPFPGYWDYINAVCRIYNRIGMRETHNLEGYEQCGFVRHDWRIHALDTWKPESLINEMDFNEAQAIRALIMAKPQERYRTRMMSPADAFAYCQTRGDIVRLPDAAVPEILGRDLGKILPVEQNATIIVKDEYIPGKTTPVSAFVKTSKGTKHSLENGSKWLVHLSPFDGSNAYISTPDGAFVGKAKVLVGSTKIDIEGIQESLKIVSQVESSKLRSVRHVGAKRLEEQYRMHEHNTEVLTGTNPTYDAQEVAETNKRHKGFKPVSLLDDGDTGDGDDYDYDSQTEPAFDAVNLL